MARITQVINSKASSLVQIGKSILAQCRRFLATYKVPLRFIAAVLIGTVLSILTGRWWYREFHHTAEWIRSHPLTIDITLGAIVVALIPYLLGAYAIHIADVSKGKKIAVWTIFAIGLALAIVQQSVSVLEQSRKDAELTVSNQTTRDTLGAIAAGLKTLTGTKPLTAAEQEQQRRQRILSLLRAQYVAARKSVDAGVISGTKEPPNDWINSQLKSMGENWTVEETTGPATAGPQALRESASGEPFKSFTDSQLADWIQAETKKIGNLVTGTQRQVSQMVAPITDADQKRHTRDFIEEVFATDFLDCCFQDLTELRKEALLRLGPRAKTSDENSAWETLNAQANSKSQTQAAIKSTDVGRYLPYFHSFELSLRERSAHPDRTIKFKWQIEPTKSPTRFKRFIVTAWPDKPINSGFILIDYATAPLVTYPTEPMNEPLQPGINPQQDVENADLMNYWRAHDKTAVVLEVDNQPITQDHPLIVLVDDSDEPKIREIKAF